MGLLQLPSEQLFVDYPYLGWDFWYNIAMFSVLSLWIYFGISFFFKGLRERENRAQRSYMMGFGAFIALASALELLYIVDVIYEDYYITHIFAHEGDYGIESIVYSDFFVFTPVLLFGALFFLLRPIELYMMKKRHATIARVNLFLIPVPVIVRYIEINFEAWFGIQLESDSLPMFLMSFVWIVVFGFAFLSIFLVIGLYFRMAKAAPKGSKLRRKCYQVIFGILFWAGALFLTGEVHSRLDRFIDFIQGNPVIFYDFMWFWFTPAALLVTLVLLTSGFSREY